MKLIATDLDGTLLSKNHEISDANKEALKLASEQGVEIIVATGRSYSAAKIPLDKAGLNFPIICLNGGKIYNERAQLLNSAPLDKATCKKIKQICTAQHVYFEVFTNKATFSESREKFIQVMVDIMASAFPQLTREEVEAQAKNRFQDEEVEIIDNFDQLFDREDIDVYKILAFSLDDEVLEQVEQNLKDDASIAITSSGFSNLEFNHPKAQKGIAVKEFAAQLGIEMKDVMAIGDNFNDASMIEMAGYGVAMGNAAEAIKDMADFTTKTNHEDGVAHAIQTLLSKELS